MFIVPQFWLFVLVLLLIYNVTRGLLQNLVLVVGSYLVYAYFDLRFLGVLIVATTVFYVLGLGIEAHRPFRRELLILGVLFAVGVLSYFKYMNFFAATFGQVDVKNIDFTHIILPLGISFYSFRLMSYLFDVYHTRIAATRSWLDLALYVSFFPQISAGPIERATSFLPRLQTTRRLDSEAFGTAFIYILLGIVYKFAIADNLVITTNAAFANVVNLSAPDAFLAMIHFSIRLYADFAGYSAMAIGVSKLFMLPARDNFRQPYFSQSIVDFWTRWHISLSAWFRDYLFFPLSRSLVRVFGKPFSFGVELVTVFATMLLIGLWHGSNVTFLVWGALQGLYMLVARLVGRVAPRPGEVGRVERWGNALLGILVTQAAVTAAWVFFGARSLGDVVLFFQRLTSASPIYSDDLLWYTRLVVPIIFVVGIDLLQAKFKLTANFWRYPLIFRVLLLAIMALAILILGDSTHAPFIYNGF